MRHEDIENLNWQTANTENESVMNSFPRNRNSGPDCFIAESYQTLKEELNYNASQTIQNNCKGGSPPKFLLWSQKQP